MMQFHLHNMLDLEDKMEDKMTQIPSHNNLDA